VRLIEAIVVDWCLNVSQHIHIEALAIGIVFQYFKAIPFAHNQKSLSKVSRIKTNQLAAIPTKRLRQTPTVNRQRQPTILREKAEKHSQNVQDERKPVSAH